MYFERERKKKKLIETLRVQTKLSALKVLGFIASLN